jgi:hypothetical protein
MVSNPEDRAHPFYQPPPITIAPDDRPRTRESSKNRANKLKKEPPRQKQSSPPQIPQHHVDQLHDFTDQVPLANIPSIPHTTQRRTRITAPTVEAPRTNVPPIPLAAQQRTRTTTPLSNPSGYISSPPQPTAHGTLPATSSAFDAWAQPPLDLPPTVYGHQNNNTWVPNPQLIVHHANGPPPVRPSQYDGHDSLHANVQNVLEYPGAVTPREQSHSSSPSNTMRRVVSFTLYHSLSSATLVFDSLTDIHSRQRNLGRASTVSTAIAWKIPRCTKMIPQMLSYLKL